MSDDTNEPPEISDDDLRSYPWQEIIANHTTKQAHSYAAPLFAEAERLREKGDQRGYQIFAFLADICSLHPNYSQAGNAYEVPWRPNQLSQPGLDALERIIGELKDPELRARVGDVLWEFRRRHKAAEIAVRALIESALTLENIEHWPLFTERLERALSLAAKLGRGKPLHEEACAEVEASIQKYKHEAKAGFLCARLIQMLAAQKRLDAAVYAALSQELAEQFTTSSQWDQAHEYWRLCAKFNHRLPDTNAMKIALERAAECWVQKADENLVGDKPDHLFASHWMGMAFQELQQAGANEERRAEVHRRFRELQKLGMQQMKPLELSDAIVEKAEEHAAKLAELGRSHVAGYSFQRAIFRLAFMVAPPDPDEIKQRIESESSQSVWMNLIPTATVTETGLTADQLGPMPNSTGPERDEWMLKSAYFHARQFEWPHLAELIDAARQQIIDEHPGGFDELAFLIASNPFIPRGHERIYLRGLHAGLFGDWLIAVHLLVPQLEASIRWVFEQRGLMTSTVESEGIQQERLLGKLLYHVQMDTVFGSERSFNLRGVLVEKFGFNLRNDMAHGFISEQGFFSPAAPVLWWLVLQMCCLGQAPQLGKKADDQCDS
jgi:tetratricopeptide (TPR) repeat protein